MKLRKLHIEDYKMFKDFDISFVDENDEALPIVILAGVNGSGKTSLLEYFKNPTFYIRYMSSDGTNLEIEYREKPYKIDKSTIKEQEIIERNLKENADRQFANGQELVIQHTPLSYDIIYRLKDKSNNIIYLDTNQDNISSVKETIIQKYIDRAFEIDKPSEALRELQEYIKYIFEGLDLTFNISSIDYNKKEVLFEDNNGVKFDISALSTGEKTLLSKVLYLYFQGYKDKVILIDEPELSLHPKWQSQVLKIYENFALKNNCQIIIATHSPHIIGSAKAEYIRLLKKEDDKIVAIENIDRSYGLEFDKILTDIMGVENLRTPDVAKDIRRLWDLLEDEDYESEEYITLYDNLEKLLGSLDEDLLLARLEIARIKSQNAKSE